MGKGGTEDIAGHINEEGLAKITGYDGVETLFGLIKRGAIEIG